MQKEFQRSHYSDYNARKKNLNFTHHFSSPAHALSIDKGRTTRATVVLSRSLLSRRDPSDEPSVIAEPSIPSPSNAFASDLQRNRNGHNTSSTNRNRGVAVAVPMGNLPGVNCANLCAIITISVVRFLSVYVFQATSARIKQ